MAKTYFIRTFGCQMNEHDSERMAGLLEVPGYRPAPMPEEAEVVIFNRIVNLPPFLLELLSVHVRDFVRGRAPIEGFPEENVEGLLFAGGTRKPLTILRPNNFRRRAWQQAVQAAGLPPSSPKILRSTHATLMAQMGLHPAAIQARLGHADARVSREYYIEYNQAMDAQVAASFEALYREAINARGSSADSPAVPGGGSNG